MSITLKKKSIEDMEFIVVNMFSTLPPYVIEVTVIFIS